MTAYSITLDGSPIATIGYDASGSASVGSSASKSAGYSPAFQDGGGDAVGPATPGAPAQGTSTPGPETPVEGASPGEAGAGSGSMQSILTFGVIGAVIWFLIFAPERKARKKKEAMLGGIKKGDKVVTTGGLHGEVAEVKDDTVTIKAGDARLTFSRASVHEIRQPKSEE